MNLLPPQGRNPYSVRRVRGIIVRVFISYRRDDSRAATVWIYRALANELGADQIFYDLDTIPIGVNFKTYIENAVSSCGIMLVIIGKTWTNATGEDGERRLDDPGDFVRIEVESGLEQELRMIPVLIDGAAMPKARDLPPKMQDLVYRNGLEIDFARDLDAHLDRLLRAVVSIRTNPPSAAPLARTLPTSAPPISEPVLPTVKSTVPPPQFTETTSRIHESENRATSEMSDAQHAPQARQTFWETGTIRLRNGGSYEGDSVHGAPHGRGTCEFPDGTRYEGSFIDGVLQGQAKKYFPNGDWYEGGFVAWKRHGRGTHHKASGDRFVGWYENDVEHGRGVYHFASGARFEGVFFQGRRHGPGIFHHLDREPESVRYEHGRRIPC